MNSLVTVAGIQKRIFFLRGQKVMLSMDLAELYDVEARALAQAVKRNRERFPDDFVFQLNKTEFAHLKSQIVTSSWGGLRRAALYAFTEQDVAIEPAGLAGALDRIRDEILRDRQTERAAPMTRSKLSDHTGVPCVPVDGKPDNRHRQR
jgi:hypothetical protein